jgi:hypothetical protein
MVRGKLRPGGVSRVTYLDENGVVHESTGRGHLEELCNKANESKLQQTSDTPFMAGALQEDVGWLGTGPALFMMSDGIYEPPEKVDEYTKKLIKHFQQNRKATEHDPLYKITPEEWKSFWKVKTKRTSCVCDILHFGTWKAEAFSETITEVDDLLTDIPLQTGYYPLRWRVAIDALLLKKSWSNAGRETAHNCPFPRRFQLPEQVNWTSYDEGRRSIRTYDMGAIWEP